MGLAGKDILQGGNGIDDLVGGAGSDILDGNDGLANDGDTDTFHYRKLSDSTPGVSGRDIIENFEDGVALFDFTAINDTIGGKMFFIGVNSKFGQTFPGDLRVMTTGAGWLVQLDAGTNGSVDLAIEVMDIDHSIVWDPVIFLV